MKKTVTKILGLLIAIILISQHLQVFAVTAEQKQLEQEKAQKAKKAKGTEKEITNLLPFRKRQAYA